MHAQRQRADGARVFRDVLAHRAVAARDGLHELAIAIVRRHGKAVHLQFGHVAELGAAQQFAHAAVEIAQFAFVQGVIQAQHGRAVRHLDETFARLAAHALGGRIGRQQFGMLRLQIAQLAHQRVVFGVADLGLVENVVQVLVVAQRFAQLFDPGGGTSFGIGVSHYSLNLEDWSEAIAAARKTIIIYNPFAGKMGAKGLKRLSDAAEILREAGHDTWLVPTQGPGTAGAIARRSIADGAELILAAGGDGTINEIAEGVAFSDVPLGILPAGTANVLANEMGLGSSIERRRRRACAIAFPRAFPWAACSA